MPTAIRWDAHSCLPLLSGIDMSVLRRHKKAGFDFVSINVGMDMNPIEQVMKTIAWFRHWLGQHPDEFQLADTLADVKAAKTAGKLAVAFDLEGSRMLLEDVAMVEVYRDLGVRQAHLIYNRNNTVGGGCHDEDIGLTAYGRDVVRAINRAGIMMDCSHNGERTSLDIMETSEKPVIFSHANARALIDHQRNITDRQIDACAATGGVIGINGIRLFLGADGQVRRADGEPHRLHGAAGRAPTMSGSASTSRSTSVSTIIRRTRTAPSGGRPAAATTAPWWAAPARRCCRRSSRTCAIAATARATSTRYSASTSCAWPKPPGGSRSQGSGIRYQKKKF